MCGPVNNAARQPANPLRRDPTRTTGIRRKFEADMKRRFRWLRGEVYHAVVIEDVFGLAPKSDLVLSLNARPGRRAWAFETDSTKYTSFMTWFNSQIDQGILAVDEEHEDAPWLAPYVTSGYKQGLVQGFTDLNKADALDSPDFFAGSRAQFLAGTFAAPESVDKIRLLYMRAFDQLKGVTAEMAKRMGPILAGGLANGMSPADIAIQMVKQIDGLTIQRAFTIARTEIIRAHAEGTLDALEANGVGEVELMLEWVTGGGACPLCIDASHEGPYTIAEARGLIPFHPNCKCAWKVYFESIKRRKRPI